MSNGDLLNATKTSSPAVPEANPKRASPFSKPRLRWKEQAQHLKEEATVFFFAFKDKRVPWCARVVAVCTAAYLFSPVQVIPSYIPVIGLLDDIAVLFLGVKLLRKLIPPDMLIECRRRAEAAATREREEIRSAASVAGVIAVVCGWMLAAIVSSVLVMRYIRH
jgi:uncharacterized membrane protein YkvA (DUF1232 family)